MTIYDLVYVVCAVVATALLGYKFQYLRTRWRSPRLWAVCCAIFFPAMAFWFAAPATIGWLNELTGVANMAVPFVYGFVTAFAASALALALFWHYPTRQAMPKVRRIVLAYGAVLVAMIALFAVSSVPQERRVDFDTYYGTQPTIAAFLMIYLVSNLIGSAILAFRCFQWSRDPGYAELPWLRLGLRIYGISALFPLAYDVIKIAAVSATWFGVHALDGLSTVAPMFAALGIFVTAAALIVPVWGPRRPVVRTWLSRWRTFLVLRPMHQQLQQVNPGVVFVAPGRRLDPHHRVRRQVIELSDWRWALAADFDPEVRAAAERLGRQASLTEEELGAAVEAAQLKAAWQARLRGHPGAADPATVVDGSTHDDDTLDGTDITREHAWWVRVARAFAVSPIVSAALTPTP